MVLKWNWDRRSGSLHIFRIHITKKYRNRHIKKTVRKVTSAMKQIWNIEQRKIRRLYKKNMDVRSHLVKSIIMYGAEIWRWK